MAKLTAAQRDAITADNARAFQLANQDYYGCAPNAAKLLGFIESQLGEEYMREYPLLTEHFQAAWQHLNEMRTIFIVRPESAESVAARQREAQKKVEDDNKLLAYAGEVQEWMTDETRKLYKKPIKELRTEAIVQRKGLQARREADGHVTLHGAESARVVPQGRNAARLVVAARYPAMNRESAEFTRLVAQEMANPQELAAPDRREITSQERQAARHRVALANPHVHRDGSRFTELVNAELNS